MISVKDIAKMFQLPDEIKEKLYELENDSALNTALTEEKMKKYITQLTEPEKWEEAWKAVKETVTPDEDGFKMLYLMLLAASRSYDKYRQCGIPDEVFSDTMSCFTRFVKEYRQMYGRYGFDREFWTGRQLSLQLFRLGELEYEKIVENGEKAISIHIPSDAVLSEENCKKSVEMARQFFKEQDKTYTDVTYYCDSWLLSPVLKQFLPDTSRIIRFQNLFAVQSVNEEDMGGIYWIFKRGTEDLKTLPENTTLQREAKQYLLKGGKIGSGKGILK